jgi:branched-chain amino acid transport system permease protein
MIASIGVSFMIRVLLTDTYSQGFSQHVIQILGQPRLYDLHTVIIVLGVLFVIILDLLITKTKLGKAMRAMADNPDLAQTSGISKVLIIAMVWIIGAGLAGMGGVLRFLANMTLFPDRGFLLLLPTFAVVILGGIGSYRGAIVAGYIVGFAENVGAFLVSTLRITSFEQLRLEIPIIFGDFSIKMFKIEPSLLGELYQIAIGFIILVIVLIIKPTGIFGEELAKER